MKADTELKKIANSQSIDDHSDDFKKDLLKILIEKSSKDVVPRRLFLKTAAFLGVSSTMFSMKPAFAGENEIVVVNWGGDAITAHQNAWASRYNQKFPDTSDYRWVRAHHLAS